MIILFFNKNLDSLGLEGRSIFNPVLCEFAFRWFAPRTNSKILDPFVSGDVSGIVANILGNQCTGIDQGEEQVKEIEDNCKT